MPVVSTRHSGIPELVEDGVSGYLVDERDAEALANRIAALAAAPETWPAMGSAGRQRVLADFEQESLADRQVDLYRACLAGRLANLQPASTPTNPGS